MTAGSVCRAITGVLTLAMAASAWGYQVRAIYVTPATPLEEGDGTQTVTVEVERESNDPTTSCVVDVTAEARQFASPPPNAATPGDDFEPTTANLSFDIAGTDTLVQQTFDVLVMDDMVAEVDEEFAAVVTAVDPVDCDTGATFTLAGEAAVPIFDDDDGDLVVAVDQTSMTVNEADGSVDIGVTLTGEDTVEGDFEVTVDWVLNDGEAVFGEDYGNGEDAGTLTLGPGNLTGTVTVPIIDDGIADPGESFDLTLSGAGAMLGERMLPVTIGQPATTVTIEDDDAGGAAFVGAPYTVLEGDGTATVTVERTGSSEGPLTVSFTTEDDTATAGSDYTAVSGTLDWADGETGNRTFTVPILDDSEEEDSETLIVEITDPQEDTQQTTLTINDNDQAATGFATTSVSAQEDAGNVVLTLVRAGSTSGAVSVDYATADGTATAGEDYVPAAGTVSWADGDGSDKTITVELIEDQAEEEAEDFSVALSNVTGPASLGANAAVTVTIDASDVSRDVSDIPTLTPNQRNLANWFDQTCPRLTESQELTDDAQDLLGVCNFVRSADTDDASVRQALDAINPDEVQVTSSNALRLSSVQHGNLSERLNALRGGATGLDLTGLTLEVDGKQVAGRALQELFDGLVGGAASADEAATVRWGAFINGRIATGDKDDTDNESGFDFDLYAVTAGVDYRVRPNFIVGVSAGIGSVETDYDADGGEMEIDSWNTSAYMTYFHEESFYLDALATYGSNDYDSMRRISFGGIVDRTARGETDGTQFSLGVGSGWDFHRGAFTFGPHLGAYYNDVDVDGFTERGAVGLDVAIGDQSTRSFTMNGGAHVSYAWSTGWGVIVPNLRADWVHEFEDGSEELTFSFVGDPFADDPSNPSPTITLRSDEPDANYAIWSVGVSGQFAYGLSGFVNYQSYAGYENVDMAEWTFGLRWEETY